MGQTVQGACPCGFASEELQVSGGMVDFGSYCLMAATCPRCRTLVVADYFAQREPTCVACGDPLLFYTGIQPQRRTAVGIWSEESPSQENRMRDWVSLPETACLCPRCDRHALHFELVGLWD
jgi:hypothetical protein